MIGRTDSFDAARTFTCGAMAHAIEVDSFVSSKR